LIGPSYRAARQFGARTGQFVASTVRSERGTSTVKFKATECALLENTMVPFHRSIAACALACLLAAAAPAFAAQAGWRQITVPGLPNGQAPIPVLLYYPTQATERAIPMGPYLAHVAPQASPEAVFKGLIVVSHGLGGSELNHESLAEALARRGYLVAALRHPGDNWQDHSLIARGPAAYLVERARHVSRVLDALLGDPQWSDRIAKDAQGPRVGTLGHSAGGYTVLALAGGRFDLARLRAHCDAHRAEDPIFCRRRNGPDAPLPADAPSLADPRVHAIVAFAPIGVVFDPVSLERIAIPAAIYVAEMDRFLVPRFHADWLAAHMPNAVFHVVPNAWHFAFVDAPNESISSDDGDLRDDPPGFDRPAFLRQLRSDVPDFFDAAFAASAAKP
jgi:predicted dienelactone hydrolase